MDRFLDSIGDFVASNPSAFFIVMVMGVIVILLITLLLVQPCIDVWEATKRKAKDLEWNRQRRKALQSRKGRNTL